MERGSMRSVLKAKASCRSPKNVERKKSFQDSLITNYYRLTLR